jgi:hypothetical protein
MVPSPGVSRSHSADVGPGLRRKDTARPRKGRVQDSSSDAKTRLRRPKSEDNKDGNDNERRPTVPRRQKSLDNIALTNSSDAEDQRCCKSLDDLLAPDLGDHDDDDDDEKVGKSGGGRRNGIDVDRKARSMRRARSSS